METYYAYFAGYRLGYGHGEEAARVSDEGFIEAVARRVRALEAVDGAVSASIRATVAGIDAERYRARWNGGDQQ